MRLNVYLYNMKTNQLNTILEEIISTEVKKRIVSEMEENKKEYYHIMCDGEPVETFNSEDEAKEHLDKWKKDHPGKQFIIEKGDYESHDDMLDKLDEMCDEKEEKLNENMEQPKIKTIKEAIRFAKNKGLKRVKINENTYDVDECWKNMEEEDDFSNGNYLNDVYEEEDCDECWGNEMEEQIDFEDDDDRYPEEEDPEHMELKVPKPCSHCHGSGVNQFGSVCKKCKGKKHEMGTDKFSSYHKTPREHFKDISDLVGEPSLNEGKKTLRLSESQFADVIKKIVKEAIPGIGITKKSREESGKENNQNIKDVEKKMKDYLSFEGNDNPEFPHHIGKGNKNNKEVVKINNNDEEDEYVEDNRGMGLQDVKYDHEPSEQFKERVKKALEGDSTMGNSQDSPNVIKTKTGENIGKIAKRKKKEIEDQPMYEKDVQPVKVVKESQEKNVIIESEIEKMKKLYSYNKKTQ